MSLEAQIVQTLQALCPRVWPKDDAPVKAQLPYIVYQRIGGDTVRYQDNTPADQRNVLIQIEPWCANRLAADALALQIEDALCAAAAFIADPQSESTAINEPGLGLFGTMQDFSIWGAR